MIDLGIRCPSCGNSYYAIRYTTSTAMYSPIIVKDGIIMNNDPNYHTYHCQCIACGKFFNATAHQGAIESIELEKGFAANPSVSHETIGLTIDQARAAADKTVLTWTKAAEDLGEEATLTLKKNIAELQVKLIDTTIDLSDTTINYPSRYDCDGRK